MTSKKTPAKPTRILHLEDNPYDTEIVSALLADEHIPCEIQRVETRKDFEAALEKGDYTLVISDFSLPSWDGLKALALTRGRMADMPFILFSGTIGEETAIECLKRGATDYVLKGRPARLVSTVRAILKEAEERERRKEFEVELQRSAQREKDMEIRFLRMQRMESIGSLVSGIAHDLNNALVPVLMGCGFLRSEPLKPEFEQVLTTMETSARRGADMLRQVLAFARGVDSKKSPVQIKLLLREMEKIARDAFPKTIRVRMEIADDLWPVSGHHTQLYQVLMNLSINARDAMPNGGRITYRAENMQLEKSGPKIHPDAVPGPYLLATVSDTGTGMPPDVLEKLFQPFFTTKEHGKGTGLGLSTSMNIVKTHGGFITVESRVGEGTRFSIYLPALSSVTDAEEEPKLARIPIGNGEGILVVDDEIAICEITKAALENYGYRVQVANSGPEAVALYVGKRKEIQLVVTDSDMPFMDGLATSIALKKINPRLKIIMASGSVPSKSDGTANDNISAFVPKPYTVDRLLKVVHEVLHQK
ncbi:MAG TPA: response regulator [Verrucomicrobiae bacterium]|jgi:signal transduction histidine kinase|nr:response regulator [Verrucomicrobiae bacterium]